MIPWLAQRLQQGGLPQMEAERQAKKATFGFEPGDIVTNVMSFGSRSRSRFASSAPISSWSGNTRRRSPPT